MEEEKKIFIMNPGFIGYRRIFFVNTRKEG